MENQPWTEERKYKASYYQVATTPTSNVKLKQERIGTSQVWLMNCWKVEFKLSPVPQKIIKIAEALTLLDEAVYFDWYCLL